MKKSTFMNAVTVVAYSAIALYVVVALVAFFVAITGGFNKYSEKAAGLKFNCMAVSIADNGGSAKLKVLSNHAVANINSFTQSITYSDPSEPIELKLQVRDKDGKVVSNIIDVPNTVMLGEEFEIKAKTQKDEYDNEFNIGGDCFLHAYSTNDQFSAEPLPVFVDIPIESATLLYFNIDVNPDTMFKRTVINKTGEGDEEQTTYTTLLYRNETDYLNDVNAILPLNRTKKDEQAVNNQSNISSKAKLAGETEHFKNAVYEVADLSCVKDDQFRLYVDVYPAKALNPHTNTTLNSAKILKNLDANSLYNVCRQLIDNYNSVKDNEEQLQNYLPMFEKIWEQLGLNGYVDISGMITKAKIEKAIEAIETITVDGIKSYFERTLGSVVSFSNKEISFNTPDYRVAKIENNILTINSTPTNQSSSIVNVSVQKIYGSNLGNAKVFDVYTEETENTFIIDTNTTTFEIKDVYFDGLELKDGTNRQGIQNITQKLVAPLNVANNRLIVSAQELTAEQKATLINSSVGYTATEVNNAVNLGIVIKTSNNNSVSNPNPLQSELKNLKLEQFSFLGDTSIKEATLFGDLLDIKKDNTTLGDDNVIWLITPLRSYIEGEKFYLKISLVQELNQIEEGDAQYIDGTIENNSAQNEEQNGNNIENNLSLASEENPQSTADSIKKVLITKVVDESGAVVGYLKEVSLKGFGFNVQILEPELRYQQQVNLDITKYDNDSSKTTKYAPIDMNSLLETEFNPTEFTYGKIIYVVLDENGVVNLNNVVNVTDAKLGQEPDSPDFKGQLFISAQVLDDGTVITNANKYNFIQPTGAGTVTIVPLLVQTQKQNNTEVPVKIDASDGKQRYAVMTDEDMQKASFSVENGNVISDAGGFVIIRQYTKIIVTVKEQITELEYFVDNFGNGNEYNQSKIFATGANNKVTLLVRANSNLALPGSDEEKVYNYTPKVTYFLSEGSSENAQPVNNEVIISYYAEDSQGQEVSKLFYTTDDDKVHYMKFTIYINPLKSAEERKYTLVWYIGTQNSPYAKPITEDENNLAPIVITAKDCYGDGAKIAYDKTKAEAPVVDGEESEEAYFENATTAYRTYFAYDDSKEVGYYNVKTYSDQKSYLSSKEEPILGSVDWTIQSTLAKKPEQSEGEATTNGIFEEEINTSLIETSIRILDFSFVKVKKPATNSSSWKYVQTEVGLSMEKCNLSYSWIIFNETTQQLEYVEITPNEQSVYFGVETTEEGKYLRLKNFFSDKNIKGIKLTSTYDAGFSNESIQFPKVNQFAMIYMPSNEELAFNTLEGWQFESGNGNVSTTRVKIAQNSFLTATTNILKFVPRVEEDGENPEIPAHYELEEITQTNLIPLANAQSSGASNKNFSLGYDIVNSNLVYNIALTSVGVIEDTDKIKVNETLKFEFGTLGTIRIEIEKTYNQNVEKNTNN